MKKILLFVLCVILIFGMAGCGGAGEKAPTTEPSTEQVTAPKVEPRSDRTVLVAYFSQTGNTKQLAEYAAEFYGADLFEIKAKKPYTQADLQYNNPDSRTSKEQNDAAARPEIAGKVEDMGKYDTVILAYPIWWGQAPRIMDTFMESYDFSGKVIVPFCTSASSDIGTSDDNLRLLIDDTATWVNGRRFAADTKKDTVTEWLAGMLGQP